MKLSFPSLRLTKHGFIIGMLFTVVLLNEWLFYIFKALRWPELADSREDNVRVLIAADPQILSLESEPLFPFNFLTTWDADRFVSRGFNLAVWKTKPDVVIFLGDILDDGSISNDDGFKAKAEHFKSLMHIPSYVKQTIYVPGDNDIGGEGSDVATWKKVQRFYQVFNQSMFVPYEFVDFTQVRVMDDFEKVPNSSPDIERMVVLLSHMPLLPLTKKKIKERITAHHPSFIFSGHEHDSYHFNAPKDDPHAQEFWPLKGDDNIWKFTTTGKKLHEVTVPTCSYRMGKPSYGYGFAVIGKSGVIQYCVLWLPSRFNQLWLYLLSLGIAFLLLLPSMLRGIKYVLITFVKTCCYAFLRMCPKLHQL
ncbi:hypothetical protein SK128_007679 [Halocaridina rubra]|uniref:Calcineurin-like phosphoesterase domain-containing protein n=1 Tax=Halocaridina rubra TaxID=373956 RepID=A0AAN8WU26_HALRR